MENETFPKTVVKPWGKEIWLELNNKYCYKRIHINAGTNINKQQVFLNLAWRWSIFGFP